MKLQLLPVFVLPLVSGFASVPAAEKECFFILYSAVHPWPRSKKDLRSFQESVLKCGCLPALRGVHEPFYVLLLRVMSVLQKKCELSSCRWAHERGPTRNHVPREPVVQAFLLGQAIIQATIYVILTRPIVALKIVCDERDNNVQLGCAEKVAGFIREKRF